MKIGVIVLDTLRYDAFDSLLCDIQEMANHKFLRMFSTSRWTPPAHASLFTGDYPTEVGVHSTNRLLRSSKSTLAEELNIQGFHNVMLSNNVHLDFFGFSRGFDEIHRGPDLKGRPTDTAGFDWDGISKQIDEGWVKYPQIISAILKSDAPTIPALKTGLEFFTAGLGDSEVDDGDTIDWAIDSPSKEKTSANFFLFANLMPCHFPYHPPIGYSSTEPLNDNPLELTLRRREVTCSEHTRQLKTYHGAAKYLNDMLPELIDLVDWDFLFILSDHGELFGEYDGIRGHQYGMYPELVHVPAVALGDKVPKGETDEPTSILDIYQTILSEAGVETADATWGNHLFTGANAKRVVYAESTGCFEQQRALRDFEKRIPKSWNSPHFIVTGKMKCISPIKMGSGRSRLILANDGPTMRNSNAKHRRFVGIGVMLLTSILSTIFRKIFNHDWRI